MQSYKFMDACNNKTRAMSQEPSKLVDDGFEEIFQREKKIDLFNKQRSVTVSAIQSDRKNFLKCSFSYYGGLTCIILLPLK